MIMYHRYKFPEDAYSKQQNIYNFNDFSYFEMK